jgi:hypothetical protein
MTFAATLTVRLSDLVWKLQAVKYTLAYFGMEVITAIKITLASYVIILFTVIIYQSS